MYFSKQSYQHHFIPFYQQFPSKFKHKTNFMFGVYFGKKITLRIRSIEKLIKTI